MPNPLTIYRTLRHLRLAQIAGQVRHRLLAPLDDPARVARWTPSPWPGLRKRGSPLQYLVPDHALASLPSDLLDGNFRFLNRIEPIGWPPKWEPQGLPKLWLYQLHYMDWLWALPYEAAKSSVEDWISVYQPGRGRDGWEPFPISLRASNWIGYFFVLHREETLADEAWRDRLWGSLARQLHWLSGHLEWRLLGNHLFENGATLAIAGGILDGPEAERWREVGLKVLRRELPEQILPDGTHFERSPMYHARILYLLELLAGTGDEELTTLVQEYLPRMRRALSCLTHPDGEIALLNDAAFGMAPSASGLLKGHDGPQGAWSLPDAGYYGYRDARGSYIVCDAGAVGPDYIPGHAHGDTLSFELSIGGLRFITDSGVAEYQPGPLRSYARSTRAHNTMEINGEDQCEFWSGFRVGRRAYPRDVRWEPRADGFLLEATHTGYDHLPGGPRHRRRLELGGGELHITDRLEGGRDAQGVVRLHLHPAVELSSPGANKFVAERDGQRLRIEVAGGTASVADSLYCPEFGISQERKVLEVGARGPKGEVRWSMYW